LHEQVCGFGSSRTVFIAKYYRNHSFSLTWLGDIGFSCAGIK